MQGVHRGQPSVSTSSVRSISEVEGPGRATDRMTRRLDDRTLQVSRFGGGGLLPA